MKRFTSKEEIIAIIDRLAAEKLTLCVRCHDLEHLAKCLLGTIEQYRTERLRLDADKVRKQIGWRETRLKNLGDRLSTFQTPQLPGVDNGDASIPTS